MVRQQPFHQLLAFVRTLVGQKFIQFPWRREQPDGIQVNAPRIDAVAHRLARVETVRFVVRSQDTVDRIDDALARGR